MSPDDAKRALILWSRQVALYESLYHAAKMGMPRVVQAYGGFEGFLLELPDDDHLGVIDISTKAPVLFSFRRQADVSFERAVEIIREAHLERPQ